QGSCDAARAGRSARDLRRRDRSAAQHGRHQRASRAVEQGLCSQSLGDAGIAGAAVGRALVDRKRRAGDDRPGPEPGQARRADRQPRGRGYPAGRDRRTRGGSPLMPDELIGEIIGAGLDAVASVATPADSDRRKKRRIFYWSLALLLLGSIAFGAYLAFG